MINWTAIHAKCTDRENFWRGYDHAKRYERLARFSFHRMWIKDTEAYNAYVKTSRKEVD